MESRNGETGCGFFYVFEDPPDPNYRFSE